jgi:argininosuccinate lyase
MSQFLWQSESEGGESPDIDKAIMAFTAGEDVILDRVLFPYDIKATIAHVNGLQRINILTPKECEELIDLLKQLRHEFFSGKFVLDERFEDGHSAIETYLIAATGDLGARVHTGRSRNDQVAVASRLYMLAKISEIGILCRSISLACLKQARRHADVPMPGYTHLQRAVPSSVGLWLGSFAESFTDNIAFASSVIEILDASPLGTAAGYGANLPLDREGVAAELGFERLQINPMAVQNARGKFELMCLQAALHALQDVRRLAWDLSLFTTSEFDFVDLPARYTTGSSIMPNKSNPDVVELLRGKAATLEAAITEIQSLLSLPSGYQRDLQLTKAPLIRGMETSVQALTILPGLIEGLEFNEQKMRSAISKELFATDLALEQAAAGIPFREAYKVVKRKLEELPEGDVSKSLSERVSAGACGDLRLDEISQRLDLVSQKISACSVGPE